MGVIKKPIVILGLLLFALAGCQSDNVQAPPDDSDVFMQRFKADVSPGMDVNDVVSYLASKHIEHSIYVKGQRRNDSIIPNEEKPYCLVISHQVFFVFNSAGLLERYETAVKTTEP